MTKKKKRIVAALVIISSVVLIFAVFSVREKILRRADWKQGEFKFDSKTYEEIDYHEIGSYEETWKVVCKTKDGVWTIYEIKQYPNQEYVVARTGWEASVCKLVD